MRKTFYVELSKFSLNEMQLKNLVTEFYGEASDLKNNQIEVSFFDLKDEFLKDKGEQLALSFLMALESFVVK